MPDITITSSGIASSYTLSQPLTIGQNIDFLNNNGTNVGVLILTDNGQGSAFNTGSNSSAGYYANIGGRILNLQPAYLGAGGDQITIQNVRDLFAELFPGGTANSDYVTLAAPGEDIQTAAQNGNQFIILPNGSIDLTPGTHFTLDSAQQSVILDLETALFGTAAAADGATVDIAFGLRTNPNSNNPFVDAIITTNTPINPCFAAGTRILALAGEIPVEALKIGDTIITHAGEEQKILWIGRRTIDITTHPRPETVRPILIEPGALAENTPARRLALSPDHAIYLDNVLVPAKELLNWTSIRQDLTATAITYFHIELARHDIIFAEGCPCETYLDTGHRAVFDNAPATQILPHPTRMQHRRATESCAPLCLAGPQLASIRQQIASRQVGIRLG